MGDSNPRDQNPQLGAEIRAMVEQQLHKPDIEAVNKAVDRLIEQGFSRE